MAALLTAAAHPASTSSVPKGSVSMIMRDARQYFESSLPSSRANAANAIPSARISGSNAPEVARAIKLPFCQPFRVVQQLDAYVESLALAYATDVTDD
jgi:hypothetical protein